MKNSKSSIVKTKVYDGDGRVVGEEATIIEVPLSPADLKDIDDGVDKNSLTLKINERHAKTETNNYNAFQPISEIKIIDALPIILIRISLIGLCIAIIAPKQIQSIFSNL